MDDWFGAIILDIKMSWQLLQAIDFALPSFICMWFLILLTPLHGMDRRDPIAGSVYTLFCMGAGVCLMFAIPKAYIELPSLTTQIVSISAMASISAFRWFFTSERSKAEYTAIAKPKSPEGK